MEKLTDDRIDVILGGGPASVSSVVADMHAMATEIHQSRIRDRTAEFVALRKALWRRLDEVQQQAARIRELEAAAAPDEERLRSALWVIVSEAWSAGHLYGASHPTARVSEINPACDAATESLASRGAKLLVSAAPGRIALPARKEWDAAVKRPKIASAADALPDSRDQLLGEPRRSAIAALRNGTTLAEVATALLDADGTAAHAAVRLSAPDRDILLRMRKSIQYSGEFTALIDRLIAAPAPAPAPTEVDRMRPLVDLAIRIREGRYTVRTKLHREDRALFDKLSAAVDAYREATPADHAVREQAFRDHLASLGVMSELRDGDLDYLWDNVATEHGFVRPLIAEIRRRRKAQTKPDLSDPDREYLVDLRAQAIVDCERAELREQFDDAEGLRERIALLNRILTAAGEP